jgi:hypothetical protein
MATYKGIKGFSIQNLSADPSNPIEGEMWYNSTSNVWKVEEATAAGAWATGGNITQGSRVAGGSAGTQNAGIIFAGYGYDAPFTANLNISEEYNGATWTAGGTLSTGREEIAAAGAGTQTATCGFGGTIPPPAATATEEYDGSTWTAGGSLPSGLYGAARNIGTLTAALCAGASFPALSSSVYEYDGSTWTAGGSLTTGRGLLGGAGLQTAALAYGGNLSPKTQTEEYNGTAWTGGGSLNTGRSGLGTAGFQTSALAFGGNIPPTTSSVEEYNGSTWSTETSMPISKGAGYGFGTQAAAVFAAGSPIPNLATIEWTGAGAAVTKTITVS